MKNIKCYSLLFLVIFFVSCEIPYKIEKQDNGYVYFKKGNIEGVIFNKEIKEENFDELQTRLTEINDMVRKFVFGANNDRLWKEMEQVVEKNGASASNLVQFYNLSREDIRDIFYRYKRQYTISLKGDNIDTSKISILFFDYDFPDWLNRPVEYIANLTEKLWYISIDLDSESILDFYLGNTVKSVLK